MVRRTGQGRISILGWILDPCFGFGFGSGGGILGGSHGFNRRVVLILRREEVVLAGIDL